MCEPPAGAMETRESIIASTLLNIRGDSKELLEELEERHEFEDRVVDEINEAAQRLEDAWAILRGER